MRVAVDFSGRAETVVDPLKEVGVTVTDENPDARITDTLSRDVLKTDVPTIYRPRSDVLRLWARKPLGTLRGYLNTILPIQCVSAVVAPDPLIARKYSRLTMTPVETIALPKDATEYQITHAATDSTTLLTLTNLDYERKTDPLIDRLKVINNWCREIGGSWVICGDGQYAERLQQAVESCPRVFYEGFVDPRDWLSESDVLVHLSELDIQYPNAILEGFCAGLPVVSNSYQPFREAAYIQDTRSESHLLTALDTMTEDRHRKHTGWQNRQYVERQHDPETIGNQWQNLLERVV